jgi:hypothetical protein
VPTSRSLRLSLCTLHRISRKQRHAYCAPSQESFREETRAYFFARDAEIAELRLRLRGDPLLVLYGRSGLGKTSILLAGLIPRLRAEKRRPLLLRLWYEESAQDVSSQLVSAVFGQEDSQSRPIPLESRLTKSLVWTSALIRSAMC